MRQGRSLMPHSLVVLPRSYDCTTPLQRVGVLLYRGLLKFTLFTPTRSPCSHMIMHHKLAKHRLCCAFKPF